MCLKECYSEHSGYFLRLQEDMNRHIASAGLREISTRIIEAFCNSFGDLSLNDIEDYRRILDSFRAFTIGVSWVLDHR